MTIEWDEMRFYGSKEVSIVVHCSPFLTLKLKIVNSRVLYTTFGTQLKICQESCVVHHFGNLN
jgi:hypothetical protein